MRHFDLRRLTLRACRSGVQLLALPLGDSARPISLRSSKAPSLGRAGTKIHQLKLNHPLLPQLHRLYDALLKAQGEILSCLVEHSVRS